MRCPFREPRNSVMRECDPTCALRVEIDTPYRGDHGAIRGGIERACAIAVIASQHGRFGEIVNTDKEN